MPGSKSNKKNLEQETQLPNDDPIHNKDEAAVNNSPSINASDFRHRRSSSSFSSSSNNQASKLMCITSVLVEGHHSFSTEQDCHLPLSSAPSCSSTQNNDNLIRHRRKEKITFSTPALFNDETPVSTDVRKHGDIKQEFQPRQNDATVEIIDALTEEPKVVGGAGPSRAVPSFEPTMEIDFDLDAIQPDILNQSANADMTGNANEPTDPSLEQEQKPKRR